MTHNLSPITYIWILALCLIASAQDLTVSKDSIKVYNNSISSFADEVIFTSQTSTPVHLDSMFILIAEMDTVGFAWAFQQKLMQVEWKGNYGSTQRYLWKMDSVGPDKYKLIKQEFRPPTDTPLTFSGSGTTSRMFFLQIGFCFVCDRTPAYPKYIKGTMRLFFSNSQVVELKLWSQDLRTGVKTRNYSTTQLLNSRRFGVPEGVSTSSRTSSFKYLANGRKMVMGAKKQMRVKQLLRVYAPRNQ
jgi:hypothetical protein